MPISDSDRARLDECLALAQHAIGLSEPNPRVGCVIAEPGGLLLGTGFTQPAGSAHAEAASLAAARAAGHDPRGATAWVSLEPCAHHGRTPPCCDALIDAGIGRVVVATVDPNPLVAGQGIARLRAAGVTVELAEGDVARAARELNIGFFSRMQRHTPWVRMKIAASLDGRTALNNGASQWITGEAARTDGHRWRKRASALLTGIGTVLEDNPRLDVRLVTTPRQPLRVIVDSRLQTPPDARILDAPGEVLIYSAADDAPVAAALRARGVQLMPMAGAHGKVDLPFLLADLAQRGVNELHVEAGHKLNASLLRESLVDELLVYLAPKLLGTGRDMAAFGPLSTLADALNFEFTQVERVGTDLRILARPTGRARFLDN
jgi:diaminohydroxyphosphoribosylaminopyrimidine deaminase/5-amino-6-(5-phosphoribosylamino)uracil reductase